MFYIKLRSTGEIIGTFDGLTSSPCHGFMEMGITTVMFRDTDGIPWELPLREVILA